MKTRSRAARTRGRHVWRAVSIAIATFALLLLAIYVVRAPILRWIGHQLVRSDLVETSDAIVVLSGGDEDREIEAADLYAAKAAPLMIITTARESKALPELVRRGVRVEREVDVRRRYLRELGVPDSAIVLLPQEAKSTFDEATYFAVWNKAHPVKSILLVTSVFHTRRAAFIFERALAGTGVVVRARPSTLDRFDPNTWWQDRNTLLEGLVEWQKTIFYRMRY